MVDQPINLRGWTLVEYEWRASDGIAHLLYENQWGRQMSILAPQRRYWTPGMKDIHSDQHGGL